MDPNAIVLMITVVARLVEKIHDDIPESRRHEAWEKYFAFLDQAGALLAGIKPPVAP